MKKLKVIEIGMLLLIASVTRLDWVRNNHIRESLTAKKEEQKGQTIRIQKKHMRGR